MTAIVVFVLYKVKPALFELIRHKAIEFIVGMKSGVLSVFKLEKRFLFFFLFNIYLDKLYDDVVDDIISFS